MTKKQKISFVLTVIGLVIMLIYALVLIIGSRNMISSTNGTTEPNAAIANIFIGLTGVIFIFIAIFFLFFIGIISIPLIVRFFKKKPLSLFLAFFYTIIFIIIAGIIICQFFFKSFWNEPNITFIIILALTSSYYLFTSIYIMISTIKAKKIKESIDEHERSI